MSGLHNTEIPAGNYPLFAPNGSRVLALSHDSATASHLITDLQTGQRRPRHYETPTHPDTAA
ncbi:hypothetical protein KIPE111705_23450 [Kibdelosporangium persicum]|uniref:hypothetical protein n=1 Tax=Kibdelosporangium persicum TaxID=2698649 RepID=UPI001564B29D|nr:hypothetical protein [Kibdelosporangium persicum]